MTFRYFLKAKFLKLPFRICSHNARILFTLYILKCSKAVSGWMGMGMEISVSTFSKSTGANKDGGTPHIYTYMQNQFSEKKDRRVVYLSPTSIISIQVVESVDIVRRVGESGCNQKLKESFSKSCLNPPEGCLPCTR